MATKYHLFVDGAQIDSATRSKKDAVIKVGDATGKPFEVRTNTGTVVHSYEGPALDPGVEEPAEDVFYEFIDFPGNYSIVTAPLAVEIASAAGVPTRVTNTKGLTRRVEFGGADMDLAARAVTVVRETVDGAMEGLHEWQKRDIERRRGLTDMQRFVEHREFIAKYGHKVAKRVAKDGI